MKKILAFLFTALAVLSAQATQQPLTLQYRIGNGSLIGNTDGRVHASKVNGSTPYVANDYYNNLTNHLYVTIPDGQQFTKWWSWYRTTQTVSVTNSTWTSTATNTFWVYDSAIASAVLDGDKYVRIVADFDYITYNLSYNGNGSTSGSMSSEQQIYTNKYNLAANAFVKTGYTFDGWTNSVVTTALANGASITSGSKFGVTYTNSSTTLYAKWTPNEYEITFNPNAYGIETNVVTVTYDQPWSGYFPEISRTGYTLQGWYTDKTSGSAVSGDVNITSNTTLYAHWSSHSFTVVFHANYGDGTDTYRDQESISYGSETTLTSLSSLGFAKTGYAFTGWATSSDGAKAYDDGAAAGYLTDSDDYVNLYAVWTPITYTIAYDANGGSGTMASHENVEYGEPVTLDANNFANNGLDFDGWATNLTQGVVFANQAVVSNLTTTADATVTLYAVWSEPRYVAFDSNGATATNGTMEVVSFEGIESKAIPSNVFEKVGYAFAGWATNETEAAALSWTFVDGATVSSAQLSGAIGETNVFYATWQTNAYTVAFNPNCSKYTGEMADMDLFYDHVTNLTANAFVNEAGLHFSGWSNVVTGVTYEDGESVSNLTAEANGVVTLYATWDNGELSKAMHCENLYWEAFPTYEHRCWTPKFQTGVGYNTDSCVLTTNVLAYMIAEVKTNGVLRFMWKGGQVTGPTVVRYDNAQTAPSKYTEIKQLTCSESDVDNERWVDSGDIVIDKSWIENGRLRIGLRSPVGNRNFVDQMTWTPEGYSIEPTEEDKPVISGFESATSGFTLRISNASDDFAYQILGTNDLTATSDWPVVETLTGAQMDNGYEIDIDADEPQMFYKVKVIAK